MKRMIVIIAIVVLAGAAFAGHSWFGRSSKALVASGTLEARNINVGSKVGGRVTKVLVREGDHVAPNQLLITFDDAELSAQLQQARGRLQQAQATLNKMLAGSRPEEIDQARAASSLNKSSPGYLVEDIDKGRFDLQRAQADQVNAERNYERVKTLTLQGIMPQQSLDDAQARIDAANAEVRSLERTVSGLEGRLQAARAQQQLVEQGPRAEDIQAARADVSQARGDLQLAEAHWAEREVRSPSAAIVEVLDLRPGDLIVANSPVAKLLESDELYVMVYVPQVEVGRVRVGQVAEVSVDAFANQKFRGMVEQIRQKAEFLPRNVQTREEREHQVFGVRVRVNNPDRQLRAGVQADVSFPEAK
jgi:ABC exporter DevB family membrane fusion protein